MNERFRTIVGTDLGFNARRPPTWILLLLLALLSFGLASGNVAISSGDSTVGGESKAWITSEFTVAMMFPMVAFITYIFFIAVAAGMAVIRDEELRVGALLHSTRLSAGEYVWGKFLAALVTFVAVLGVHLLFQMFCNHLWPNANAEKIRGPFELVNYLRPALVLALPMIVFFCGISFWIGERWRKPILVFVTPVAFLLIDAFFLWDWSPTWLDPRINRLLGWIDPSGYRWLDETWLKLDRGIDFYNTEPVHYDLPFLLSRVVFVALGIGFVALARRHFEATVRATGKVKSKGAELAAGHEQAPGPRRLDAVDHQPLAGLGMRATMPGFLRTVLDVARFEASNLRSHPGLYLFVPVILLQTIGSLTFQVGAFDTPLLLTPGVAAVGTMNTLTLLVCLLLLFYTVESVARERNVGLASIYYATPARTAAMLIGKAIANGIVGVVILLGALVGALIVIAVQGKVPIDLTPFLLAWGLLLVPTFVVWATFAATVFSITGSRYATYAVGLAVLLWTGWKQFRGEMNWVGNWDLWSAVTWTDFGSFEPNIGALILNRLFYLAVMVFLIALTMRIFPRREHDSGLMLDRLRPKNLVRTAIGLSPAAFPAIVLGTVLFVQVGQGFQGETAENRDKDYWARNVNTWADARTPEVGAAEIDVALDPATRFFKVRGSYALVNATEEPLRRLPMSIGNHFENVEWTLGGESFEPDNRSRLCVFELDPELAPGDTVVVGFSHEGYLPEGITKNGGGVGNFILPVGVVLTSFNTGFVPIPYFEEERGVDDENRTEPKDHPEDYFEGRTPPGLGSGARFPVRTTITGPAEFQYHGVGVKVEETVEDGVRTVVWNTDHPVNFFNVIAGRWAVWEGDGASIYYLPEHHYNIEEMGEALVASRRHYSEWFYPYPWQELKLSEFAGLATYAQGFPTNITFSEHIGFLTRSREDAQAAFVITAHEAAHQWWGNILMPGDGPGANILSEGMAHFSTVLLTGEVKGDEARIEFLKQIEESYSENRRVDSEKPLVWVDGTKAGDTTVTYDKGGWVFWMLHNLVGEEASVAGLRGFIDHYSRSDDFPVLQDFVRFMRDFAPDVEAYDAFVSQWFFEVVVPEYALRDARKEEVAPGRWQAIATVENVGTGRIAVEVAATRGERFGDDPDWQVARQSIVLGAGEATEVTVSCDFEPETLVMDPDARVLMLDRDRATAKL